jgi:uncharacterized Zn finger protein
MSLREEEREVDHIIGKMIDIHLGGRMIKGKEVMRKGSIQGLDLRKGSMTGRKVGSRGKNKRRGRILMLKKLK